MSRVPTAIDLFAGCGGFSTGLLDAGISVLAGFDHDRRSIEAFDYNHIYRGGQGYVIDLASASGRDLLDFADVDEVDLVVGGPPCQPYSIAGKQLALNDRRGNLVFDFVRLVEEIRPKAVVFENVANFDAIEGGTVADRVRNGLAALGFAVRSAVLNAADYGVPQMRKRLFIVGLKTKSKFEFPPTPTHGQRLANGFFDDIKPYATCREAIDDLPDVDDPRARNVHNHEPTLHTPTMLEAFSVLLPGGRDRKSFHDRLHPDRPGYTLRAGTGNFSPLRPVHYEHDRVVTVRESARLQGFDDEYVWPDWIPRLQQYRQVGNAVPPPLGRLIGETIASVMGWRLDPNLTRGDPSSRPNPNRYTYEERTAARLRRMRGASLGSVG